MGTITAFVYIGTAHPNHGGINPSYCITLSENSRPCLKLMDFESNSEIIKIIPTIENMIDDIYFLLSSFIVNKKYNKDDFYLKEMYEIFTEDERKQLYSKIKNELKDINLKIVFNILDESTLLNQLEKVQQYSIDYEITTPLYRKEYNHWTKRTELKELK